MIPNTHDQSFFQAVKALPEEHVNVHLEANRARNRFLFDLEYTKHEYGSYKWGKPDGGFDLFRQYFKSDWYQKNYRFYHLPYGDFIRPYSYKNHFYYGFSQSSYSPVVVYGTHGSHVLDGHGFCTHHEHHHQFFESQAEFERRRAAILEYWWASRNQQYDNLVYVVEINNSVLDGLPLDYSDLIVEERIGNLWNPIIAQPITISVESYRIGAYRIRFEIEVSGRRFYSGRTYRVYVRTVFRREGITTPRVEFSNASYLGLAERADSAQPNLVSAEEALPIPLEAEAPLETSTIFDTSIDEVSGSDSLPMAPANENSLLEDPNLGGEAPADFGVDWFSMFGVSDLMPNDSIFNELLTGGLPVEGALSMEDWEADYDDPALDEDPDVQADLRDGFSNE